MKRAHRRGQLRAAFGFLISWGTLTDPDTIRAMLLLDEAYVFLMMGSAVARSASPASAPDPHAAPGPAHRRAGPGPHRPVERRHIVGSATFGLGWAIADTCPGPVPPSWGRALPWALCTAAGITGGVLLFQARRRSGGRREHIGAATGGVASGQA